MSKKKQITKETNRVIDTTDYFNRTYAILIEIAGF